MCLWCLELFWSVQGFLGGVEGCIRALRGISIPTNFLGALIKAPTFSRRPGGSRSLKYLKVTVILSLGKPREALGEVSKLRYKSLL